MPQKADRLARLHDLLVNYNVADHKKLFLPVDNEKFDWFKKFKYLNPTPWAVTPQSIPYISATTLLDSYLCLPRRPDMAFIFLWTAINSSYNDLYLKHSSSGSTLSDAKGIENSILLIAKKLHLNIESKDATGNILKTCTINEIVIEFCKRLPDKNLNFLASYLLKGIAITLHNESPGSKKIRDIHISSSYKTFLSKRPEISNHLRWGYYGQEFFKLCNITESADKTSINFGITDTVRSRNLTHATAKELQRILIDQPLLPQFDASGAPLPQAKAFAADKDRLGILVSNLLYATRNNNVHGNVASRVNSIFSNSDTVVSATWNYLFGYFYLSLLLLCLQHINQDDLNIHMDNIEALKLPRRYRAQPLQPA